MDNAIHNSYGRRTAGIHGHGERRNDFNDKPVIIGMGNDNSLEMVDSQGGAGAAVRKHAREPAPALPPPAFPHEESACDSFSPTSTRLPLWSSAEVQLPQNLKEQMERPDALAEIFNDYPSLVPVHAKEATDRKGDQVGSKFVGMGNSFLSPQAAALAARTGPVVALADQAFRQMPSLSAENPTSRFGGPVDVPTPATLRTLMLQPSSDASIGSQPALNIRLSGVALEQRHGRWSLMQGQAFHPPPPVMSDRIETVPLPPNITAFFDHGQRRWFVVSDRVVRRGGDGDGRGVSVSMDKLSDEEERTMDPAVSAFIKAGGRRVIGATLKAAEGIVEYYRYLYYREKGCVGKI